MTRRRIRKTDNPPQRRWTEKEDEFIKANLEKTRAAIGKLLGRTTNAVRTRIAFLGVGRPVKQSPWARSPRTITYGGPAGWDESQGPPCLLCSLHHHKIANEKTDDLCRQCQECSARIRWDHFNGGLPMRVQDVDPLIYWLDAYAEDFEEESAA